MVAAFDDVEGHVSVVFTEGTDERFGPLKWGDLVVGAVDDEERWHFVVDVQDGAEFPQRVKVFGWAASDESGRRHGGLN